MTRAQYERRWREIRIEINNFGKIFRLTCAIICIPLGMANIIYSLGHNKLIEVVVSAAIIAASLWWITNFMGNKDKAPEGALERYARNEVIVKQILEIEAQQANVEGTDVEIDNLSYSIDKVIKLKPEIEQKYNVTMILTSNGCIIKPNTKYLNNYWN